MTSTCRVHADADSILSCSLFDSVFEYHHRFAGWTSVALVWIFVGLSDALNGEGGFTSAAEGRRLAHAQEFWFALIITVL